MRWPANPVVLLFTRRLSPARWLLLLLTLLAASGHQGQARAQERAPLADSIQAIEELSLDNLLNQLVVTASGGVAEERSLAAANVFVVSRDTIERHGWQSLAEILANVPGLYVIGDLATPALTVRGISGGMRAGTRIVKVMIDGHSVNFRPDLTAFLGPEYIPIAAVERVEVAKGPLSALYGADAFVATVNVITRKPQGAAELDFRARAIAVGDHLGYQGGLLTSVKGRWWSLLGAVTLGRSDRAGLALEKTFNAQAASLPYGRTSTSDLTRPLSTFLRLDLDGASAGSLSLSGGLQRLDADGQFQLNSLLTERSRIAIDNLWTYARYNKSWGERLRLEGGFGYSQGAPREQYQLYLTGTTAQSFHPNFAYRSVQGMAALAFSVGERASLKLAIDTEYAPERVLYFTQIFHQGSLGRQPGDRVDLIDAAVPRSQTLFDLGAHVHGTLKPLTRLPDLQLTGDLRFDVISHGAASFPLQHSWRAAAAYRWSPALVTKVISGRAFQVPSGVLLFAHQGFGADKNVVGSMNLPQPRTLQPQTITAVEAVATGELGSHVVLELAAYFQSLQRAIEFAQEGVNFAAINTQGKQQSAGVEVAAQAVFGPFLPYARGGLQRSLGSGQIMSAPPPQSPTWSTVVGCELASPKLWLTSSAQLRSVGQRGASQSNVYSNNNQVYQLPSFHLVDVSVAAPSFSLVGGRLGIALSVFNLLDERPPDPGFGGFDLPTLGRIVGLELRQRF